MGGIAARASFWGAGGERDERSSGRSGQQRNRASTLTWWVWSWGRKRPVYVVVAEEDPAARRTIASKLRSEGHNVVEAADGPDLVDLLRAWYYPGTHAARVDVIVANADLFPQGSATERPWNGLPGVAAATPVVWMGRRDGPCAGVGCDVDTICRAVDRLIGKERAPR